MSTPQRESDVHFWLRKLFDVVDTDATIQREKQLARDPMRPPRPDGVAVVSLQLWENYLRERIAAALSEAERVTKGSSPDSEQAVLRYLWNADVETRHVLEHDGGKVRDLFDVSDPLRIEIDDLLGSEDED